MVIYGKSRISMAIFHAFAVVDQRVMSPAYKIWKSHGSPFDPVIDLFFVQLRPSLPPVDNGGLIMVNNG